MFASLKNLFYSIFNINKKEYTFNDKLINTLEKQHKVLFTEYKKILNYATKKKYRNTVRKLNEFKKIYTTHILIEDNKLYTYLEKIYKKNDPTLYNFINSKQDEMKKITQSLLDFIDKFNDEEILEKNLNEFIDKWNKIGELLTNRVSMEQTKLYTLYRKEKMEKIK